MCVCHVSAAGVFRADLSVVCPPLQLALTIAIAQAVVACRLRCLRMSFLALHSFVIVL